MSREIVFIILFIYIYCIDLHIRIQHVRINTQYQCCVQMYFCIMDENFRKSASQKKFIELEVFNDESIEKFQNEIANLEMHNQLDANINKNPNDNYKIVSTLLQTAINKHIPKRIVKFNKRRHKKERWMTNELLAKIVIKSDMYVDWKTTPVTSEHFERVKLNLKDMKNVF